MNSSNTKFGIVLLAVVLLLAASAPSEARPARARAASAQVSAPVVKHRSVWQIVMFNISRFSRYAMAAN